MSNLKKRGLENGNLAKFAIESKYILITCDSDFLGLKRSIQEQARIIYIKIHPRDPVIVMKLLDTYVNSCAAFLQQPGKAIITKEGCTFKKPLEK